jgi:hypothetical protein
VNKFLICVVISDQCNEGAHSYSNLGHSFSLPDYTYGTLEIRSILGGQPSFRVVDIEVFGIPDFKTEGTTQVHDEL